MRVKVKGEGEGEGEARGEGEGEGEGEMVVSEHCPPVNKVLAGRIHNFMV